MYRRYSQVNENAVPASGVRRNRAKNIVILALVLALVGLTVTAVPLMRLRSSSRGLIIQRMQSEIAAAVRLATGLSRNAGASSASILAQIRSNIYAISVANDLSFGMEGISGRLIPEETLTSLQNSVDNYLQFLTYGMDTGEYQTNLQNALDTLQLWINALK